MDREGVVAIDTVYGICDDLNRQLKMFENGDLKRIKVNPTHRLRFKQACDQLNLYSH